MSFHKVNFINIVFTLDDVKVVIADAFAEKIDDIILHLVPIFKTASRLDVTSKTMIAGVCNCERFT